MKFANLIFINLLVFLGLLGLSELFVRNFLDVVPHGVSKELFVWENGLKRNRPYSISEGHGAENFADGDGYRVASLDYTYPAKPLRRILLIGDSIMFGLGVPFERTIAGLLQAAHPNWEVKNAAVIGWNVFDYRRFVRQLGASIRDYDEVVFIYCLNDLINKAELSSEIADAGRRNLEQTKHSRIGDWLAPLKAVTWIADINAYLRARSHLYVLLKSIGSRPQERWFRGELIRYLDEGAVSSTAEVLQETHSMLHQLGVKAHFFVAPYEFQLRRVKSGDPPADIFLPQKRLEAAFDESGIDWIDLAPHLLAAQDVSGLYNPFDAMHLSEGGHEATFHLICTAIRSKRQAD